MERIRAAFRRFMLGLVLSIPDCREVYQGMLDGQAGRLPRSQSLYYLGGWHDGYSMRSTG